MAILIALLIIGIGIGVSSASIFVIRFAARRPANGELHTLECLDRKIIENQEVISAAFKNRPRVPLRRPATSPLT